MISSLFRIFVIGRITLTEAVRQKVLNVLLIFGIVLIACSVFVSNLATPELDPAGLFAEQIKFIKDFGCGAIGLFGFAIALRATAELIPQELQNRTVYTILAKPVRRAEFLLGKFLGVTLLLALFVALMSLVFAATLYWQEVQCVRSADAMYGTESPTWGSNENAVKLYNHDVAHVREQIRDPQLIKAVALIFAKLVMTAAIALLISTFATSSYFTMITTAMVYLIGHLESTARLVWLARGPDTNMWQSGLVGLISLLIPDLNSFTIVDEILAGNHVPLTHTLNLLAYADLYVLILLGASVVIFEFREL